ncbi:MAG: YlxR family protein [Mycobacteriaceae bacterium]
MPAAVQYVVVHRENLILMPGQRELDAGLPVRMCIGCRKRTVTADLLRVVVHHGSGPADTGAAMVVPDPRQRLLGRGAWLHYDMNCLLEAQKKRAFTRALRMTGAPDIHTVEQFLQHYLTTNRSVQPE